MAGATPGRWRRWRRAGVTGGRAAVAAALEGMQVRDHHRLLIRTHLDRITLPDRQGNAYLKGYCTQAGTATFLGERHSRLASASAAPAPTTASSRPSA